MKFSFEKFKGLTILSFWMIEDLNLILFYGEIFMHLHFSHWCLQNKRTLKEYKINGLKTVLFVNFTFCIYLVFTIYIVYMHVSSCRQKYTDIMIYY